MNVLHGCSVLALALFARTPADRAAIPDILPLAQSGITLEVKGDSAPTLLDLLREYERVTGMHLVFGHDLSEELGKVNPGLQRTLSIPQDQVHTLVETLLAYNGYSTLLLHAQEPVLLAVRKTLDPQPLSADAVYVDAARLASIEKHPALACWTILDLDAIDPEELLKSLGMQWNETRFRLMTTFGGTHNVVLLGGGTDVAERARVLSEMNERLRRKQVHETNTSTGGPTR